MISFNFVISTFDTWDIENFVSDRSYHPRKCIISLFSTSSVCRLLATINSYRLIFQKETAWKYDSWQTRPLNVIPIFSEKGQFVWWPLTTVDDSVLPYQHFIFITILVISKASGQRKLAMQIVHAIHAYYTYHWSALHKASVFLYANWSLF